MHNAQLLLTLRFVFLPGITGLYNFQWTIFRDFKSNFTKVNAQNEDPTQKLLIVNYQL